MAIRDKIKRPFSRIKKLAGGLASGQPSSSSVNDPEPVAADQVSLPPGPNDPPPPVLEQSAQRTTSVRGQASGQPPASPINDHGQNNTPEPIAPNPVSSPPGPNDPNTPNTERSAGETAWATLKTSIGLLQASVSAFGPLKSAFGEISQSIDVFQRAAQSRKDYETLANELESIIKELSGYLTGSIPPIMTSSIKSLAKGIEREIKFVADKEKRNKGKRFVEAMDDSEEILQCYSRIQRFLERLVRNANMDTWRILDEQATTNRLRGLPYSPAAKYLSAESTNLRGKGCTENTRVDVLETLRGWACNDQSEKIYWLNGMAGTGKTTIADSLCAQLKGTGTLAASFFCSRQLPECNDVNRILSSISYQLAQFSLPFRHALSRVLQENSDAHNQPLLEQFEHLIAQPLQQVKDTIPNNLVVVIDALDECVDQGGVDQVLETLLSHAKDLPIKFFVTSRPESKIRDRMLNPDDEQIRSVLHLHDLERSIVRKDIKTYFEVKLKRINLPAADLEHLVERSGVLFIYAATLVRYIEADNFSRYAERLGLVLNASTTPSSIKDRPIDELYSTILHAAFDDPGLEEHEKDEMERVLRTVVCAQEPLTVDVIAGLLGLDTTSSVRSALRPLFSVLHVSETSELVTTLHQSFPDYMFDKGRSKEFSCDKHQHNAFLAGQCFSVIGTPSPPFNICSLESSYVFDEDVPSLGEKIEKAISPELFYACRYWGAHLELAETSESLVDALHEFLSLRLLLWMEVMNLKRCIHDGAGGLYRVEAWSQRTSCPLDIQHLAMDAYRFVITFSSSPASRSTPHIYISALPFWPEHRPVSMHYSQKMHLPKASGTAMRRRESAPLAICVTPGRVTCVAYSSNGARIVSGSGSGSGSDNYDFPLNAIRIWDAHTGQMIGKPLEGHTGTVCSVAYSSDNAHIVSGSWDETIRIWDAHTGQMIGGPLKGHTGAVNSVAYSSDNACIVSGSSDKTIRIWDAHTGQMIGEPLKGHASPILSVAYSPDNTRIVSGSGSHYLNRDFSDDTIRIWDAHAGQMIGEPLKGHTDAVTSVAYSSDNAHIVSGSFDKTIRIWDAHTGQMIGGPLKGHTGAVTSVAYSSDNAHIISGSSCDPDPWTFSPPENAIRIWDAHTGQMIGEPLKGHTDAVNSVAYSSDNARIVSGSSDKTIRIWDTHTGQRIGEPPEGHSEAVKSVAFSSDNACIVSGSDDETIRIWDAHTGKMIGEPLKGHTKAVNSVAYSSDNARIVSGSDDQTIQIWDAHTGQMIGGPLKGHTSAVTSVAYSSDNAHIVSGSFDKTILIWDAHTGQMIGGPLKGHIGAVTSVAYSSDNAHIISGSGSGRSPDRFWGGLSFDNTIRIWDAHTGQMIGEPLKGHTGAVTSVAYSSNNARIVFGSSDQTIRIWDAHTGKMIGEPFKGHTGAVTSVAYSSDNAHIVSGSWDGTIRMWDAHTGQMIGKPLEGHTGWVNSIAYSPDNVHIVSGSSDHTVRVANLAQANDPCKAWVLDEDGYMRASASKLLMWVPPDVRKTLLRPQDTVVISVEGSVKVDFTNAPIGDSWAQCFQAT